jgi:hypothetical protein
MMSDDRVRRFRGRSDEDELFPNDAERFKLNGDGPGNGSRGFRIEGVEGDAFSRIIRCHAGRFFALTAGVTIYIRTAKEKMYLLLIFIFIEKI